ncbi:cuticular protein 47Eg [Drosophila innubila]|uniref:cuticular protein 47Eg n=1 Tax=Drosophila innubila TaxID=198719 RepID=UPI00148DF151|nr:cuticular protein 47Eg [Drosophila innubila]
MKFLIVLACLLAVAYAGDERSAVTTEEKVEVNPEDFKYTVETSNGISAEQSGHVADGKTNVVVGKFEYTSPEGVPVSVSYEADENGYRVVSSHP